MVCLGNICRSPLAEGILRNKIQQLELDWTIDSAGTGAWHIGECPDSRSIAIAAKNSIDISMQRARQFKPSDWNDFDLIFAMDSSNYKNILRTAPSEEYHDKLAMIMNLVHPNANQNVPDPYWDDNGFEQVFEMLSIACDALIDKYA